MLPGATEQYLGTAGLHIVQVLFVASLFACILSFDNIVARYVFTLSNRKVFPAAFSSGQLTCNVAADNLHFASWDRRFPGYLRRA